MRATEIKAFSPVHAANTDQAHGALNEAERHLAEQAAHRLYGEIKTVLGSLPPNERGASAMSRSLGIDRATCQRIVSTITQADRSPEMLVRMPGVQGLRQWIEAIRGKAVAGEGVLEAAGIAIDQFEDTLTRLAGSQRRLAQRLSASERFTPSPTEQTTAGEGAAREALFHAAAEITGRWSEASITIYAFRPSTENPRRMERLVAMGQIGHRSKTEAVPLVISSGRRRDEELVFTSLNQEQVEGASARALLEPFCSKPLPRITSRSGAGQIMHVIDPIETSQGDAVDMILANRTVQSVEHPAASSPAVEELWNLMSFPARRLVFDVYMHRELARISIPGMDMHLWGPELGEGVGDRWFIRFPSAPKLTLLGTGLRNAATPSYTRHAELTHYLFEQAGWPAGEFIGYRCEVSYPVWRAGYCMSFDFTGNELEPLPNT